MQAFLKSTLPLIREKTPHGVKVAVDVDPRHVL
jgi:hypothetical protein